MTGRERCEVIIGLIDHVLAECEIPVSVPTLTEQKPPDRDGARGPGDPCPR